MSSRTGAGSALDGLSQLSRAQRLLTIVVAVAPLLVWTCTLPAGAAASTWALIVVLALSALTAARPDSLAGLLTVLFLGWYWLTHVVTHGGGPLSPWALAAALLLLAFHTATAARATAPGPADLDQAFWRRWLSRVAVIGAGTCCLWGLTAVISSGHQGQEDELAVVGAVAAFAVLAGGTAYARWRVVRGR
jgi:hypothetical protein